MWYYFFPFILLRDDEYEYFDTPKNEHSPLPEPYNNCLTDFQKLLLIKAIRFDKLTNEIAYFVENNSFYVPSNVYIIGTMNTYDDKLAVKDYALRRRFCFYTINRLFF